MEKKQLVALFMSSLIGWTIAQGLLALLPVYAVRLGADSTLVGNYLALAFGALTAGTVAAGWLSDKFQRRKTLLVITGLVNIPATWLMGQASAFWHLAVLTAIVWCSVGIGFTSINILAGLFAGEAERGKVFGILAINTSLGALIGGAVTGPIVDRWGFPVLFLIASLCWVLQPMIGLLLKDKVVAGTGQETASNAPVKPAFGTAFYLLLLANIIAFGAGFVAILGRPLLMDRLGFDSTAISGVVAVGGAVSLPFPFLLGRLSDRVGRYWLIAACFLAGAIGLVALSASFTLWHFWVSAILLAGGGVSLAIGSALVTDLVPPEILGKALAWYGFAPPAGGILGFMLTGYALQTFGMAPTFIGGAVFTLFATALVIRIRRAPREVFALHPATSKSGDARVKTYRLQDDFCINNGRTQQAKQKPRQERIRTALTAIAQAMFK